MGLTSHPACDASGRAFAGFFLFLRAKAPFEGSSSEDRLGFKIVSAHQSQGIFSKEKPRAMFKDFGGIKQWGLRIEI